MREGGIRSVMIDGLDMFAVTDSEAISESQDTFGYHSINLINSVDHIRRRHRLLTLT